MNAVATPELSIATFEAATIDADAFNHESHVFVAWLYLERWPLQEAIKRYCDGLRHLTKKLGADTKYHETITWFFMIQINQRRATSQQPTWFTFRRDNLDLINDAGKTLDRYYSKKLLMSDLARQTFLLPDKISALTT